MEQVIFFFYQNRPALGPTLARTENLRWALSRGVKRPGRLADHSPPSSSEVKHNTRSIPRAHKDSSSCNVHPVPVIGHHPVPNTASPTTDRPNKWRRYLLHYTTFSVRCANQRPNVLLSPPPGGKHYGQGVIQAEVKGRHRRQALLLPSQWTSI